MASAYCDGYCCGLGGVEKHEVIGMADRTTVMSWLEGLAQDDWRMFHSDSEVQEIAKAAFALLKEQEAEKKCCKDCEYYGSCHDT